MLPIGNVIAALSRSEVNPDGAIVEESREGKELFIFKGTQSKVNTFQTIDNESCLFSEFGAKPRLFEVNRVGMIQLEFAPDAQTKDQLCRPEWPASSHTETTWCRNFSIAPFANTRRPAK